jgi:hypothetical protein
VPVHRCTLPLKSGPGSVVGIATGYGLDGPGIESRRRARLSAPVQTGPGANPASCTMGTGSFPGVKSGQGVILTPHALLVPWSRKSKAIHTSTPPMARTACTEPQCLYKGALYLFTSDTIYFKRVHKEQAFLRNLLVCRRRLAFQHHSFI